jgi:hypothetical protein
MFHKYVATVCSKCFICSSLSLEQVFSCCKLQVFYLDVVYVFTHMLQVYFLDVSFVSDVCCIQVFYVARVPCCSESQERRGVMVARHGHQGMGRDKSVAGGRGARHTGVRANGRGGVRRWGRVESRQMANESYGCVNAAMRMQVGRISGGVQAVQAHAGNGRLTESYSVGRPDACTSFF